MRFPYLLNILQCDTAEHQGSRQSIPSVGCRFLESCFLLVCRIPAGIAIFGDFFAFSLLRAKQSDLPIFEEQK